MIYRTALAFAWYERSGRNKLIYPIFETLEAWLAQAANGKPSTKLQVLIDICLHILSDDDRSPPTFDENTGEGTYPQLPNRPEGEVRPQASKGIVYQEFTSQVQMTLSVRTVFYISSVSHLIATGTQIFSVYGIKALAINGTMSILERAKTIATWSDPKSGYRILIISVVGSQGLNLLAARFVILFVSQVLH
jgi:hypothetical protein